MIFYSRRSAMLIALTIFTLVSLILAGYAWIAVGLILLLVLFGVPQRYEVQENEFVIRSGLLRRRFPYTRIRAVEREWNAENSDGGSSASVVLQLTDRRKLVLNPREPLALQAVLEERIQMVDGAASPHG